MKSHLTKLKELFCSEPCLQKSKIFRKVVVVIETWSFCENCVFLFFLRKSDLLVEWYLVRECFQKRILRRFSGLRRACAKCFCVINSVGQPRLRDSFLSLCVWSHCVLLCFIKPMLGNRYVRSLGFIVSEPRETHPRSEILHDTPPPTKPPAKSSH